MPQAVEASAVASLKPFSFRLATAELAASWAVAPEPPAHSVKLVLGLMAMATHCGEEATMTQPELPGAGPTQSLSALDSAFCRP